MSNQRRLSEKIRMLLASLLFVIGLLAIALLGRYGLGIGDNNSPPEMAAPARPPDEGEKLYGSAVMLMAADKQRAARQQPIGKMRTWSDRGGIYSIEAELLVVRNGYVGLRRKDGTVANLAIERLSDEDLEYLAAFMNDEGAANGPGQ